MWLAFAGAALLVLASTGWVTGAVLRLDAAESESRRRAQLEENVRLALWRMDSALAPLIAAEHARPGGAFTSPVSAPLPGTQTPFVTAYFRYTPSGAVLVPAAQAANAPAADHPEPDPLRALGPYNDLLASLPPPAAGADFAIGPPPSPEPEAYANAQAEPPVKGGRRSYQEYQARAANTQQQVAVQSNLNRSVYSSAPADVVAGPLRPLWAGDALLLARRVAGGRADSIQVCRIDWLAVRQWLLDSVKDLLPGARLVPTRGDRPTPDADARLLASLPVRLDPGPLPGASEASPASPLRVSLLIAWACVLTAIAAVGLLLAGVASLSERRGAFVSAVTHELRTPLTTLRMYTEMLADGMVPDEPQRRSYLQTLRAEADRLGHLVENVLAYSRLERKRAGYAVSEITLADATGRTFERLRERARQAGMELRVDVPDDVLAARVRTNALALEQILFNLVDNACKYAAGPDKRIELTGQLAPNFPRLTLTVRDHGPGIPAARRGSLFLPFSKSVQEAANSAPGLGLGLAISRRLAVSIGGDLREGVHPDGGAVFVVRLPVVATP
jgi:signal transduction histidine kinase